MNTKQLYVSLMREPITRKDFDGVFSRDTLKDIQSKPTLIICNTDNSDQPGSHWVLFYFHKDTCIVDFYDPLGKSIKSYGKEFYSFAQRFAIKCNQAKTRTQPTYSSLCGMYCLYFAFWRCQGYSLKRIVKSMTSSKHVTKLVHVVFMLCKYFNTGLIHTCKKL